MKYGDGALTGTAGMKKHLSDFNLFIKSPAFAIFKKEMLDMFSQKENWV